MPQSLVFLTCTPSVCLVHLTLGISVDLRRLSRKTASRQQPKRQDAITDDSVLMLAYVLVVAVEVPTFEDLLLRYAACWPASQSCPWSLLAHSNTLKYPRRGMILPTEFILKSRRPACRALQIPPFTGPTRLLKDLEILTCFCLQVSSLSILTHTTITTIITTTAICRLDFD
ncbi:hypothetical protein QBC45DRAFT_470703 [Copromyces sp. CBS 386.78]|nr:hypothetical protein QBC45DRAFT_470703 [Copromyces sp. CBS 386.78]